MEVTTVSGQRLVAHTAYPKGHQRNPLSDADVETKFRRLAETSINGATMQHSLAIALGSRAPVKPAGAVRHASSVKASEVGVERYTPISVV